MAWPASSSPLSYSDEYNAWGHLVYLDDGSGNFPQANVVFAGLAPGFAGLYQVNFTLPASGVANGDVYIAFNTSEALNEMATISLSGFSQDAAQTAASHRASRLRGRAIPAGATRGGNSKKRRRALPDRSSSKL